MRNQICSSQYLRSDHFCEKLLFSGQIGESEFAV